MKNVKKKFFPGVDAKKGNFNKPAWVKKAKLYRGWFFKQLCRFWQGVLPHSACSVPAGLAFQTAYCPGASQK